MLDMWDAYQPAPGVIVDVGAGVGVFTAAAATRWPNATVYAVDVNPVTLGLLAVRLYGGPEPAFGNVRLVLADYTEWIQTLDVTEPMLILGNPPYTRAQLLPVDERRRLQALANGLSGSRASLSTVITAISLLALGRRDGLCLLLPAQWLESDYATDLRTQLWSSTQRRVELRLVESSLFADAQVDAVVLLVGTEDRAPGLFVSTFSSDDAPTQINKAGPPPDNWRRQLGTDEAAPTASGSKIQAHKPTQPGRLVLADVAAVKRGIATGANSFFALTVDQATELQLEQHFNRPLINRLRDFPDDDTIAADAQGLTRRLLEIQRSDIDKSAELRSYIAAGVADGVDQRHLCRQRSDWFDLRREVFVPHLILGPMSREKFRVVSNEAGAAITNNLYGLTWSADTPPAVRDAIVRWLRSWRGQAALRGVARNQSDGLLKIEPKAVQQLPLPVSIGQLCRKAVAERATP